jgi:hypothetical protein
MNKTDTVHILQHCTWTMQSKSQESQAVGQTMNTVLPGEVPAVWCGVLHVSAMQSLKSVILLSSVCHTAASTVGSYVLEGTAGTEGRQKLPFPYSQNCLQKTN